jgi:hypothetical protein
MHCYAAQSLSLLPKFSQAQHSQAVKDTIAHKLVLDGGIIHLPNPDNLVHGWEDAPASLPDILQAGVEHYFDKSKCY